MIAELLLTEDLKILWAAMVAMVDDVHCPQDNLSEEEWIRAGQLKAHLDVEYNFRMNK